MEEKIGNWDEDEEEEEVRESSWFMRESFLSLNKK